MSSVRSTAGRRSMDDKDYRKDSRIDLPMSNSSTETGSMRNIPITSAVQPRPDEPNWPRSWRAYACWLGCFFLMFNSWGLVNAYGTFASYYVGNSLETVDQLQLNLIGSTQSFLILLFSAPAGRLLDAGYFRYVIACGAFLVPFGMFMLSVAHPSADGAQAKYAHIWVTQGLVVGLGMACYFVSSSQVAATWFPNRKGLAVGFVACGASVAGVVYPTMTRYLIDAMGFVNACRMVATLVAVTSIFSLVFSTPNPKHVHVKPKSWAVLRVWIDTEAFKNKAFCWFTASVAFLFFGFYPVFFNLEEWAAVSGYGTRNGSHVPIRVVVPDVRPLQTFWLLTIMNGASTVGRLTMAAFSDKTGPLNMHIVSQIISSLLVLLLWTLANSTGAAIGFCVVFGMFSGAVIGLPPASMANILNCTYNKPGDKQKAHSKLGQWTGMMYSFAAIPSLVGPIIAGHLVTEYSTYITVQAWAGANLMVSAACMLVARWYLPCVDGQRVSVHLARRFGTKVGRAENPPVPALPNASETDIEARSNRGDMSTATTRVPSKMPSRQFSDEKIATMSRGGQGSDNNV